VTGGYEISRSVTTGEIFAGTWVKRRYCSFEQVLVAPCTPLPGKGCVASNLLITAFGLDLLLGLRD
jgi:hypothetical protein